MEAPINVDRLHDVAVNRDAALGKTEYRLYVFSRWYELCDRASTLCDDDGTSALRYILDDLAALGFEIARANTLFRFGLFHVTIV
jgi:hypothetical protein